MDMKENSTSGINYFRLIDFMKEHHGKPYEPKSKDVDYEAIDEIKKENEKIINFYQNEFSFDYAKAHNKWNDLPEEPQNGKTQEVRNYWWLEFSYKDNPIGVSIFADSTIEGFEAIYCVCLEINDNKSKEKEEEKLKSDKKKTKNEIKNESKAIAFEKYNKHLDYPIPKDNSFVYIAEFEDEKRKKKRKKTRKKILKREESDITTIKTKLSKGEYIKVRPCKLIECNDGITNDDIEKQIINAIDMLIKNYSELLGKDYNDLIKDEQYNKLLGRKIMQKLEFDRNIILYGPPGTGKTRYTAIYAALIGGFNNSDIPEKIKEEKMKKISIASGEYWYNSDGKEKTLEGLIEKINEDEDLYKLAFDYYRKLSEKRINLCDEPNNKKDEIISCFQASFVTFHQSYSYEEFIEGIKPKTKGDKISYKYEDGIFKSICKVAEKNYKEKFIIIIDEINRGNISKIFGEMITSIEDNRRYKVGEQEKNSYDESIKITLPYTKERFLVPDNVYIIGTMNTADRSIAMIDTALRRRFSFVEMIPRPNILEKLHIKDKEIYLKDILDKINQRIEVLLDREHTIGHAFFTKLNEKKDGNVEVKELGDIFKNKIIPLLQEYFYEDYEYIALVLGEDITKIKEGKDDNEKNIIIEKKLDDNLFKSNSKINKNKTVYKINDQAFDKLETYQQIIGEKIILKTELLDNKSTEETTDESDNNNA